MNLRPADTIDEMDFSGVNGTPERRMRADLFYRELLAKNKHLQVRLGGDTSMGLVLGMTGAATRWHDENARLLRNPFA
jgi:hypothetical protein